MMRPVMEVESHRCAIRWARPRVLLVEYAGHVPADDRHVRETEEMLRSGAPPVALCFELTHMRSFHRTQVAMHGQALARLAPRVAGIALVGAPPAARFGAVTVSLMSKIPLRSFDAQGEALTWLEWLVRGAR
jgi:hypothetical protein